MRQVDRRAHDEGIAVRAGQLRDEELVDLQLPSRQLLQIRQARQAGAVIVDCDDDANVGEALQVGDRRFGIADDGGFRHLEPELGVRLGNEPAGGIDEGLIGKQLTRDIDEDAQVLSLIHI